MIYREKITVLLDPRTCNLSDLNNEKELRDSMLELLVDKYSRYGRIVEIHLGRK